LSEVKIATLCINKRTQEKKGGIRNGSYSCQGLDWTQIPVDNFLTEKNIVTETGYIFQNIVTETGHGV